MFKRSAVGLLVAGALIASASSSCGVAPTASAPSSSRATPTASASSSCGVAPIASASSSSHASLPTCAAAVAQVAARNEIHRREAIKSALVKSCPGGAETKQTVVSVRLIGQTLQSFKLVKEKPLVVRDPPQTGVPERRADPFPQGVVRWFETVAPTPGVAEIVEVDGKHWVAWVDQACQGCGTGVRGIVTFFTCPGKKVGVLHVSTTSDPNIDGERCRSESKSEGHPCDPYCETLLIRLDVARVEDVVDLGAATYAVGHVEPVHTTTDGGT